MPGMVGKGTGLRRDRATLATGAALILVVLAAWWGVVAQSQTMAPDMAMDGAMVVSRGAAGLAGFLAAWIVMMAAMMLPSALPLVLLYRMAGPGSRAGNSAILAAGYLLVWGAFGVPVYLAQEVLGLAAATNTGVANALPYGVAAVLIVAGVYQLTPLKEVCLRQCRNPLDFLVQRWRAGSLGALRLGVEHGAYCVGCCWGLMAVLVAAGAMGLAWVALIALVIFAEKLLPGGQWVARLTGAMLVGAGALLALWPEGAMLLRGNTGM